MRCGRTRPRLGSGGLRAEASKLFYGAAKLGDARSRAIQPASTRRSQPAPDEPRAVGVTDGSVRLAVGLANIDEIRTDLDRALAGGGG
ncbi:PLP-dependent transferase [Methylorubrum extorquens]